ncbi:MAG TPA: hypothetical protein VIF12_03355 [Micavibrio sp.]
MATDTQIGPDREELRGEFDKASKQGKRYLLLLNDICESELDVETIIFTQAIDEQSEIVPLLKNSNAGFYYDGRKQTLAGIFDLKSGFDEQYGKAASQIKTILSPETLSALKQLENESETARAQHERDQLPFYQKWFSTRP